MQFLAHFELGRKKGFLFHQLLQAAAANGAGVGMTTYYRAERKFCPTQLLEYVPRYLQWSFDIRLTLPVTDATLVSKLDYRIKLHASALWITDQSQNFTQSGHCHAEQRGHSDPVQQVHLTEEVVPTGLEEMRLVPADFLYVHPSV